MTTDKTPATLATAKHGGCVQLPTSERARALLANAYEQDGNDAAARSVREDDLMYGSKIAVKAIMAALSAQPSPGGQGDALDCIGRIEEAIEFRVPHDIYAAVHGELTELKAALAARQPVGEIVGYMDPDADFLLPRADGCVLMGKVEVCLWRTPSGKYTKPLYATPPAPQPAQVYLDGLDRALGEAIEQRDRYHERADDLAEHIAAITGVDIGEHSSANCPWQNAIEAAEEYKPAQAVDLDAARREGHDCAVRYVLGYLNGTGDLASTKYGEILNGCGRESIIRSAIRDGELEFTGLGRWVSKYGTDAERALIGSQAVGNG